MRLHMLGRTFYGTCLIGLGIQQFVHAGFLPIFLPGWPTWLPGANVLAYVFGAFLIVIGVVSFLDMCNRELALISAGIFLTLFFAFMALIFYSSIQTVIIWAPGRTLSNC